MVTECAEVWTIAIKLKTATHVPKTVARVLLQFVVMDSVNMNMVKLGLRVYVRSITLHSSISKLIHLYPIDWRLH